MDNILKGVLITLGIAAVGLIIYLLFVNLKQNSATSSVVASEAAAASSSSSQPQTYIINRGYYLNPYQLNAYRYGTQYLPINPFPGPIPYGGPQRYVPPVNTGPSITPSPFPNHLVPSGGDFNQYDIPIHT